MSSAGEYLAPANWPKLWRPRRLTPHGTAGRGTGFTPKDPAALLSLTAAVHDLPHPLPCHAGEALSEDPLAQEHCATPRRT